jgi:hypothetical protein
LGICCSFRLTVTSSRKVGLAWPPLAATAATASAEGANCRQRLVRAVKCWKSQQVSLTEAGVSWHSCRLCSSGQALSRPETSLVLLGVCG